MQKKNIEILSEWHVWIACLVELNDQMRVCLGYNVRRKKFSTLIAFVFDQIEYL
jgi:hypothetical protein